MASPAVGGQCSRQWAWPESLTNWHRSRLSLGPTRNISSVGRNHRYATPSVSLVKPISCAISAQIHEIFGLGTLRSSTDSVPRPCARAELRSLAGRFDGVWQGARVILASGGSAERTASPRRGTRCQYAPGTPCPHRWRSETGPAKGRKSMRTLQRIPRSIPPRNAFVRMSYPPAHPAGRQTRGDAVPAGRSGAAAPMASALPNCRTQPLIMGTPAPATGTGYADQRPERSG